MTTQAKTFREQPLTVNVPAGILKRGSTLSDIDACVDEWTHRLINPEYVPEFRSWIMKEYPQHPVQVSAFEAMVYPVTNGDFKVFICSNVSNAPVPESVASSLPDNHPVWGITLQNARDYADWLAFETGRTWRLPREKEWEWMARGPSGLEYPFGPAFDSACCNTVETGRGSTTPIDAFSAWPSWCGICDLAGNVEEWCDSIYAPYPGGSIVIDDLIKLVGPNYPILRGGSFLLGGDLCRGARRHGPHPGTQFRVTGFRLVCDLE